MPQPVAIYKCLLISPSDLEHERDLVDQAIRGWNAHNGESLQARVEVVRWEVHARPQMGAEPQSILNEQILAPCDFGIALFWSRLGSPTETYESGSVEEIERLLASGKEVMIYFCDRPVTQSAASDPQFQRLQDAKTKLRRRGLVDSFSLPETLPPKILTHISSLMGRLINEGGARPSLQTLDTSPQPDVRVLTQVGRIFQGQHALDVLVVTVQNYSSQKVFLSQVRLSLEGGRELFVKRDAATFQWNMPTDLEPGNSYAFHVASEDLTNEVNYALAIDKIGRRYKGSVDDMRAALRSLLSVRKPGQTKDV